MVRPVSDSKLFQPPELNSVFKGLPSSTELMEITTKINEINLGLIVPNCESSHNLKLVKLMIRRQRVPPEPCLIVVNKEVDMNEIGLQSWRLSSKKEYLFRVTEKGKRQETLVEAIVKHFDPSFCTYELNTGLRNRYKGVFLYTLRNLLLSPVHFGMSYPMKHSKLDIPALKECLARRKKLSL
jgi:hypothetical protein